MAQAVNNPSAMQETWGNRTCRYTLLGHPSLFSLGFLTRADSFVNSAHNNAVPQIRKLRLREARRATEDHSARHGGADLCGPGCYSPVSS